MHFDQRKSVVTWLTLFGLVCHQPGGSQAAMTLKQLMSSMDMMRSACAPKFKVTPEMLDNLRKGKFDDDRELRCYTLCIAQMAGTMTKKGEISLSKTLAQLDAMLPPDMKDRAKAAVTACKDTQAAHKDTCDKTFFSAKCMAEFDKDVFLFP